MFGSQVDIVKYSPLYLTQTLRGQIFLFFFFFYFEIVVVCDNRSLTAMIIK